jgi:putative endonuclease
LTWPYFNRIFQHDNALASKRNGTLYIGVTSDLAKRVWQHKKDVVDGFTKRYSVHQLVWYELHETMESAIGREKALKNWKRVWKLALIENSNPGWRDLYETIA